MGRSGSLILGGFLLFAGFATPAVLSSYDLGLLSLALMYGMAAMAQTFLTGTANQASLGNSAFLLIGAYGSASLSSDAHLPFLLAALLSILIATFVGIVVGLPTLRISGLYLAVATIALVFVVQEILTGWDSVVGRNGVAVVRPLWMSSDRGLLYSSLIVAALFTVALARILGSRTGRALSAMRESDLAAASMGVNLLYYRTLAFAVSAAITAAAGILIAQYDQVVTPSGFGLTVSLSLLTMAVVGGLGSIPGAYIGAFLITLLPNLLGALPASLGRFHVHDSTPLVSAILLLITLTFLPGGIWSGVRYVRRRARWRAVGAGDAA